LAQLGDVTKLLVIVALFGAVVDSLAKAHTPPPLLIDTPRSAPAP
jgi:hypothetical protein